MLCFSFLLCTGLLQWNLHFLQNIQRQWAQLQKHLTSFVFYSTGLDYIRSHLDCQAENHVSEDSHSSEEEDLFSSLKKTGPLETTQQLDAYLGWPGDTVEVLKSFPAVCQLSLKLNTALPASAACCRAHLQAKKSIHPVKELGEPAAFVAKQNLLVTLCCMFCA